MFFSSLKLKMLVLNAPKVSINFHLNNIIRFIGVHEIIGNVFALELKPQK